MVKKKSISASPKKQPALFDDRFLESYLGVALLSEPVVAVLELISNAWDAGASSVQIRWPEQDGEPFLLRDNGHGMTDAQFQQRYRTLSYNREKFQGTNVEIPTTHSGLFAKRTAYGRNGKGRLAGFTFGESYWVQSHRNGKSIKYHVKRDYSNQLAFYKEVATGTDLSPHGTEVSIPIAPKVSVSPEVARREIGMRFLMDPNFKVTLNGTPIDFTDVPETFVASFTIDCAPYGNVTITVIDVQTTDRTTHQHGIAWWVKGRLVGECTWKGSSSEHFIDGRRAAAKRYSFIVKADQLADAVSPDWTDFLRSNPKFKVVWDAVEKGIRERLLEYTKEQRESTFKDIEDHNRSRLKQLSVVKRAKWEEFIKGVQEECPLITDTDMDKLGALMANLELSESKYALISLLSEATPGQLNNVYGFLKKWDIDFAKVILDELEYRMSLLESIQQKVLSSITDEVQDLQPLFHRGLWIFGPQYETIEFTSNKGMTKVIQDLLGRKEIKGTLQRPDFAILPDSTVGLYSLPSFNVEGDETGIEQLTIVELKAPRQSVGDAEKTQAWTYIKELLNKGVITSSTKVQCFVLGVDIDPNEGQERTELNGRIHILPMRYDTVITRAKSRLLNLYGKVKDAPFLKDKRIRLFTEEKAQLSIPV